MLQSSGGAVGILFRRCTKCPASRSTHLPVTCAGQVRRRVHPGGIQHMRFAGQPSLRSGSRSAGGKASPPPPRVTFVNAAMFRQEDTSTSMFLLRENRVRADCQKRGWGRTGECFFCGSDCLSAAKTGPRQAVTRKHAERRAAGLARRHLAKQL